MPAKQVNVNLGQMLGKEGVAAWEASKDKAVRQDTGGQLPGGIEAGVAKVKSLSIGLFGKGDNIGKPFFMGQAVVVEPKTHEGVTCAGRQCSIGPIPLCDSKDWQGNVVLLKDNYDEFINHLKLLGLKDPKALSPAVVQTAMAALVKAGVYTSFRTWKPNPSDTNKNPRTKTYWTGSTKYNGQAPAESQVKDHEAAPPADSTPSDVPPESQGEQIDLDALAADAMSDETKQLRLKEIAVAVGITEQEFDDAPNWETVVEMIRARDGAPAPDAAPVDPWEPKKDLICFYTPKGAKRAVEVKITGVSKDKKTVELVKASDAKVKYSKIAVGDLEHD